MLPGRVGRGEGRVCKTSSAVSRREPMSALHPIRTRLSHRRMPAKCQLETFAGQRADAYLATVLTALRTEVGYH